MSEYQYVGFRAIDAPVSDKNLAFMRKQSSRAEITPWSFDNEYDYGDFHGDAEEMLRRGYDVHLHYANFGIRKLMIRLPNGLPDAGAAKKYSVEDSLYLLRYKKGPGAILGIEPYLDPGELEDVWEPGAMLSSLLPLRGELIDGDLRPLYLAHLAVASDENHDPEEEIEGPVPACLNKLTAAQQALAKFYELDKAILAAAAEKAPPLPGRQSAGQTYAAWLERQPATAKDAWLAQLLADPRSSVRREILAAFHEGQESTSWPTIELGRTIAQLRAAADRLRQKLERQAADKAARQRAKKLAQMAADPSPTLRQTEELVKQRGTDGYQKAAELLADLREALAGTDQAGLAETQARKLKEANPTLRTLIAELRRKGFVPKDR